MILGEVYPWKKNFEVGLSKRGKRNTPPPNQDLNLKGQSKNGTGEPVRFMHEKRNSILKRTGERKGVTVRRRGKKGKTRGRQYERWGFIH